MDSNYLLIIFVVLVVAAAFLFVWTRRDRTIPRDRDARVIDEPADVALAASEGLIDPVSTVPGVALGEAPIPPPLEREVAAAAAPAGPPDDLTLLKGLGAKAAAQLNALGITRYDQLAALSGARLAAVDAAMGALQGRLARDRWVEQAGHLAAGDRAGFEAKFGKLGG